MSYFINYGNQSVTIDFKLPLKGSHFSKELYSLIKPGVYKGLYLSIANNNPVGNQIDLSKGQIFLNCSFQAETKRAVKVEFQADVHTYSIPQTTPGINEIVYILYEYAEVVENWAFIGHCPSDTTPPENAIIIGECIYDGLGNISSISYNKRQYGFFNSDADYTISDSNVFSNTDDSGKRFKFSASGISPSGSISGVTGNDYIRQIIIPDHDYQLNSIEDWISGRSYKTKEVVLARNSIYRSLINHTAGIDFTSDLDKWENITDTEDEEKINVFNNSGSTLLSGKVVKISGDEFTEMIPEVDLISNYLDEPFGIVIQDILTGTSSEIIQRGRIELPSYDFSLGIVGQRIYSDDTGNLTLFVTKLMIGQLLDPVNSIIYVAILPAEEGLNVVNFNGQLSINENTVQKSFDRLDDYGYIPNWSSGKSFRVGNSVKIPASGNSIYICVIAHTSINFNSDISNWTLVTDPTAVKYLDIKDLTTSDINLILTGGSSSVLNPVTIDISKTPTFNSLTVTGEIKVSEININQSLTISTSGNLDNVNVTGFSFIRFSDASKITGFNSISGFNTIISISNISSSDLTIANDSVDSNSGNRILTGSGIDMVLKSNSSVILIYDLDSLVWRVFGVSNVLDETNINQIGHSFSVDDRIIFDKNSSLWKKANTLGNYKPGSVGKVKVVIDSDNFTLKADGEVIPFIGIPGEFYYVDETGTGTLTPITPSVIVQPALFAIPNDLAISLSYPVDFSAASGNLDAFIIRQSVIVASGGGIVNLVSLYGSQAPATYRFKDGNNNQIYGTVYFESITAYDLVSSTLTSSIQGNSGTLNIYDDSGSLTFENQTSSPIALVIFKEI